MRKTKIMIVEDEVIIAENLKANLEYMGYEIVSTVCSGEQSLEKAERLKPDLVLMDIVLEGKMDGIEAAFQLKTRLDVPVVFLSAYDDESKLNRAKQSAAYGYLLKPFSDKLLHTTVTMALHKHQMEKKLRKTENRYRSIMESIQEGYFEIDPDGGFIFLNDAMSRITGYPIKQLLQMDIQSLMEPNMITKFIQAKDTLSTTDKPSSNFIFKLKRKDAQKRFIDITILSKVDTQEMPNGFRGIARDVTDEKKKNIELIQTSAFLQRLLESSIDGISTTDLKGEIVYVTPRLEKMSGNSLKGLVGQKVTRYYKNGIQDAKFIMRALLNTGELKNHEMQFVREDGKVIDILLSATLLKDENQKVVGTLGIFKDIIEKKRIEEQSVQLQKLEAVGVLASGVAHDFNNLLTAILGNITLAQMYSKPDSKVFQLLSESEKACIKAKELTDRLTAFSRRGDLPQKKIDDITEILKDISKFLLIGSNVTIDFQLQKNLWMIEYDVDWIKQMISDIITNAIDAMPKGGKLKIIAQNMTIKGRDDAQGLKLPSGKYVKIAFQDHGIGIAKDHLSKVFDPYFSTKEMGLQKGMGLGLSSVYAIVKKHGGHIRIESTEDTGTTISVYMPAFDHRPLGTKTAEIKDNIVRTAKGTILVMDDEEMVREVIGEMLSRLGYGVKFARNGSEAVALYSKAKESGSPLQAVILDITIPGGMGGKETLKQLQEIDPGIKAFVSSGYTEDSAMIGFRKYGFSGAIAKPYGMENLSKILDKFL